MASPNFALALPYKKEIVSLKKSLVIKRSKIDDSTQTQLKTSVFDIPVKFWQSGLDSFHFRDFPHSSIKFSEFAKNRENYEYVKEFNRLNSYQPTYMLKNSVTGDLFQVNKGFVMGVADDDEPSDLQSDENKYSFLAEGDQFSAKDIDFSDPTALLRR